MPEFLLAVVLILIVILILVLIVALILLVILIAILVIHSRSSENLYLRYYRFHSVSVISTFILCFEKEAYKQTCCNGRGYSTGTGFQSAGEDSEETVLLNRFLNALCKIITETG